MSISISLQDFAALAEHVGRNAVWVTTPEGHTGLVLHGVKLFPKFPR